MEFFIFLWLEEWPFPKFQTAGGNMPGVNNLHYSIQLHIRIVVEILE